MGHRGSQQCPMRRLCTAHARIRHQKDQIKSVSGGWAKQFIADVMTSKTPASPSPAMKSNDKSHHVWNGMASAVHANILRVGHAYWHVHRRDLIYYYYFRAPRSSINRKMSKWIRWKRTGRARAFVLFPIQIKMPLFIAIFCFDDFECAMPIQQPDTSLLHRKNYIHLAKLFHLSSLNKQTHLPIGEALADVCFTPTRGSIHSKSVRPCAKACVCYGNAMCEHANSSLINLLIFPINIRARSIQHKWLASQTPLPPIDFLLLFLLKLALLRQPMQTIRCCNMRLSPS